MYASHTKPIKMLIYAPDMFYYTYLYWGSRIAFTKYTKRVLKPKHYARKTVMPDAEGNERIKEMLLSSKPFTVGRPGATDLC